MQTRPRIEIKLQKKIIKKHYSALKLIEPILNDSSAKLDSVDSLGKSFLHHALEVGFKEVADELLILQKNNAQIIFGTDSSQQTCLFLAAKQGYMDIAETIIHQSKEIKQKSLGYKIWLTPDIKGNSPLHVAAENRKTEIVQLLIKQILKDENGINHINRVNEDNNTALHLACFIQTFPCDNHLINLLIQHGADLGIVNENNQTPFQLLCQRDMTEQANLFTLLANKQELFLSYYRDYAKQHRHDASVLQNYCQLIKLRDEQMYISAKQEFDQKATSYFGLIKNLDDHTQTQNEIPAFLKEGVEMANVLDISEEWSFENMSEFKENKKALYSYQLLAQDQDTIKKLIKDIETYLADLQTRPTILMTHKALTVLVAGVCILALIAMELGLGIMSYHYHDYNMALTVFGTVGFFMIIGSFELYINKIKDGAIPINISHDEWNILITNLRTTLLDKLQDLENKETQDKKNHPQDDIEYLPIQAQLIRNLENNVSEFNAEKKSVTEVIDMFTRLDDILKQIQKGMRFTNKPFSLFYKPQEITIPMENISSNANEATPILREYSSFA